MTTTTKLMAQFRLWDPVLAGTQPHGSRTQLTERGEEKSRVGDVLGPQRNCLKNALHWQCSSSIQEADPYSVTYFCDLVIITLPFAIDSIPTIPLLFPCSSCFSLCFTCSPLFTSFSPDEEETHSLLLSVPLLWSPYESHSLKSSAS